MWFPWAKFFKNFELSGPASASINSKRLVFSDIFSIPNGLAFPPIVALATLSGANSADLDLFNKATSSVSPATLAKDFSLRYSLAKSKLLITFPLLYHSLKIFKKIKCFCVFKKIVT